MKSADTFGHKLFRAFCWLAFIAYISILAYLLFFSEYYGRTEQNSIYRYNLKPFFEIRRCFEQFKYIGLEGFLTNIVGNILAFVPFGFCLPLLEKKQDNFFKIFIGTAFFSFAIESVQLYYKVGSFDVDDIILNTLGGIIGFAAYRIIVRGYTKRRQKTE